MLKEVFVTASVLLLSSQVFASQKINSKVEAQYLSNVQCKEAVFAQLNSLNVTREWSQPMPRELDGSVRLLSPTNITGVWVEARVFLNKEVVLRRVTEHFLETREFDLASCRVKQAAQKQNTQISSQLEQKAEFFTDRDLRTLIKTNSKGVIYIWSPNMPYSYETLRTKTTGIENVKAAASKVGAAVTVLLDPSASRELANEIVAQKPGMSLKDNRSVQSIEIGLRAMGTHYPVVIVYAGGKIARYSYPGVGTEQEYLTYIQGQLNELQK